MSVNVVEFMATEFSNWEKESVVVFFLSHFTVKNFRLL